MYTGTSHSCETAWLHASKICEQHSDQLEREQAKHNARSTSVDGVGRFVALLFTFSVACASAFGKHSGGPRCCRWVSLAFVVHFLHLQSAFAGDLDVNFLMFPHRLPFAGGQSGSLLYPRLDGPCHYAWISAKECVHVALLWLAVHTCTLWLSDCLIVAVLRLLVLLHARYGGDQSSPCRPK